MSDDWTSVADLTGCRKLHGAQGPAPTIAEMVAAFREDIDSKLKTHQPDLVGFGLPSLVSTLLLRLSEWKSVASASTNVDARNDLDNRVYALEAALKESLEMLEAAKREFAPTTTNSLADETIARIKLTLCKG